MFAAAGREDRSRTPQQNSNKFFKSKIVKWYSYVFINIDSYFN